MAALPSVSQPESSDHDQLRSWLALDVRGHVRWYIISDVFDGNMTPNQHTAHTSTMFHSPYSYSCYLAHSGGLVHQTIAYTALLSVGDGASLTITPCFCCKKAPLNPQGHFWHHSQGCHACTGSRIYNRNMQFAVCSCVCLLLALCQ